MKDIYIHIYIYVYMCICVYIRIYIYIYMNICTAKGSRRAVSGVIQRETTCSCAEAGSPASCHATRAPFNDPYINMYILGGFSFVEFCLI